MLTRAEIEAILRGNYPRLAAEYGVRRIGLFGSYAKEKAVESSDVDLLIELDRPLGFKFIELTEDLEKILGRPVDVLTQTGLAGIRVRQVAKNIAESVQYVSKD